jgi:hypothetical protein
MTRLSLRAKYKIDDVYSKKEGEMHKKEITCKVVVMPSVRGKIENEKKWEFQMVDDMSWIGYRGAGMMLSSSLRYVPMCKHAVMVLK